MNTIKSAYQHAPLSNIESLIILHEPILTKTIKNTQTHTHINHTTYIHISTQGGQ